MVNFTFNILRILMQTNMLCDFSKRQE